MSERWNRADHGPDPRGDQRRRSLEAPAAGAAVRRLHDGPRSERRRDVSDERRRPSRGDRLRPVRSRRSWRSSSSSSAKDPAWTPPWQPPGARRQTWRRARWRVAGLRTRGAGRRGARGLRASTPGRRGPARRALPVSLDPRTLGRRDDRVGVRRRRGCGRAPPAGADTAGAGLHPELDAPLDLSRRGAPGHGFLRFRRRSASPRRCCCSRAVLSPVSRPLADIAADVLAGRLRSASGGVTMNNRVPARPAGSTRRPTRYDH